MKRIIIYLSFITAVFFAGCTKDSLTLKKATTASGPEIAVADSGSKMVVTPFGLMKQSDVHYVAPGTRLEYQEGRLLQIESASGKLIKDYGVQKPVTKQGPVINSTRPRVNSAPVPAFDGYVTFSSWYNFGSPITYFATDWVVPTTPPVYSGQTLFMFNGLENGDHILQPVLQYGPSQAGGGGYWSIANWYAGCQGCTAYYSALTTVPAGTLLHGVMQQTAQSGSNYSYTSSFTNYPSITLPVANIPQLFYAMEAFEQYNVTSISQYTPDNFVAMKNIEIRQGTSQAPVSWSVNNDVTNYNQHTVIVNGGTPNGEVDLYFRNPPPPIPTVNINNAASVDWNNGAGSGSGTINAPAGTLVHLTVSAYGPGTTTQCQVMGATLSVSPGNYVYMQNNSLTQTFTMPASGYVNWNGYFSRTGTSGTGHISVY